jgi:hypothetical protein
MPTWIGRKYCRAIASFIKYRTTIAAGIIPGIRARGRSAIAGAKTNSARLLINAKPGTHHGIAVGGPIASE